jgi:O-antigen ligase
VIAETENDPHRWWKAYSVGILMVFYYAIYAFNLPTLAYHLPTGVLLAIFAISLVSFRQRPTRPAVGLMLLMLLPFVHALARFNERELFFHGSQTFGLLAILAFYSKQRIPGWLLLAFLVAVVLPGFFAGVGSFQPQGNEQSLFPLPGNKWRVHVGPVGSTLHFTAELGWTLFILGLSDNWRNKWVRRVVIGLGLYFAVFSGSRTALIVLGVVVAIYFTHRAKLPRKWIFGVVALAVFSVYFAQDVWENYLSGAVANQKVEVGEAWTRSGNAQLESDVTSGRSWLWEFHWTLFTDNPILGAGMETVEFSLGDTVDGEQALAASESYYSQMLAAFGLFGIAFIGIHLILFVLSIGTGDLRTMLLGAAMLISTAGNSSYGRFYAPFQIFLFACLASDLGLFKYVSARVPANIYKGFSPTQLPTPAKNI